MKQKILLIAMLFIAFQTRAITLTLNNANPSAGQYNTWATVLAAATDGDTILVHGSTNNYYSMNVNKKLTIIGPGHNPTDKQNAQKAFCDNILFSTGSNGSKVIGMEASNMQCYSTNVDSISILLCKINDAVYFTYGSANFWLIEGCVFTNTGQCIRGQGQSVGDLICRNNIFNGIITAFNGTYIGYNYFNNNIFLANTANTFTYCNYFYINNNIFYRSGFQDYGNSGLIFNKNCSYQCLSSNSFPNGNNYENVNPLFETTIGTGAYFSYNTNYHLQATSPLLNAGSDGTNLGVYGGSGDFDQKGVPHNPYIKTFTITGSTSVNAGDPIQIYIKAKVRN
ncbi:MAG: hypothetical protein R2831_11685 [Chitinophagaceae bacterium]